MQEKEIKSASAQKSLIEGVRRIRANYGSLNAYFLSLDKNSQDNSLKNAPLVMKKGSFAASLR